MGSISRRLKIAAAVAFTFFPCALAVANGHCTANQTCWPSPDTWSAFNRSVDGQLVTPRPPGWVCHDPNYDETACNDVKTNWNNSFWRTDQPGAMMNIFWDSPGCNIDTPRNVTCEQGFVPIYSVDVRNENHVSEAVKFAGQYNLKLVVKNTGHDFFGRSSGEGSFSIWTHHLKGIHFTDSFISEGCSGDESKQSAVTVGAAELWVDVYRAAEEHNVTVVGGAGYSVGAAGGWVQGGGHSPISGLYGLGVDNTLQFKLVKPDGQIVMANKCQNQDLFWALRGGGSGTWGVILDVTYKTYPPLNSSAVVMTINTTNSGTLGELSEVFFQALPSITDQGLRGYGGWTWPNFFYMLWIHPNSPSLEFTNSTLRPIYDWVEANNGTQVELVTSTHSTFYDMYTTHIHAAPAEVVPFWFGTRLVSRNDLAAKSKDLAKYIFGDGASQIVSFNLIGGGAVSEADPESTGLNPQWRRDALLSWQFITAWSVNSSAEEINQLQANVTKVVQEFGKVTGLEDAAYFNEADPHEPQWKKSFFGSHYDRLLEIKKKIDPTGLFMCNRCVGSDQ
ncbi:FAD-binding domain protein [Rhizoctonia solani AG-3 Rhs1AP]|uniref:FAD-binding domain protein n=2 Tax=Rhizoctonia solani AG-3 TaxID=1086053 RepID=A0A074RZB0_9AGAM|nr:FAD-binding domain protein [Rhizoctonia solani AG-3 Rhs1AP]KEP52334.1 FAD-binding domain protein [Rhizoctonia solani 123E]